MFKSIFKKIGILSCLIVIFVVADYYIGHSLGAILNSCFIFGLAGTNSIAILFSIVFLVLLWLMLRENKKVYWPMMFISAATLSNVADRFLFGGVVDYFKLSFIPTFNLADITIIICVVYIMKILVFDKTVSR